MDIVAPGEVFSILLSSHLTMYIVHICAQAGRGAEQDGGHEGDADLRLHPLLRRRWPRWRWHLHLGSGQPQEG